jgi:hypothetical protein
LFRSSEDRQKIPKMLLQNRQYQRKNGQTRQRLGLRVVRVGINRSRGHGTAAPGRHLAPARQSLPNSSLRPVLVEGDIDPRCLPVLVEHR